MQCYHNDVFVLLSLLKYVEILSGGYGAPLSICFECQSGCICTFAVLPLFFFF